MTSHSKSDSRNSGTIQRPLLYVAPSPAANISAVPCSRVTDELGAVPSSVTKSVKVLYPSSTAGSFRLDRVGLNRSSTGSPPADHAQICQYSQPAERMYPYWRVRPPSTFVVACVISMNWSHVHGSSAVGNSTPASSKMSLL